MTVGVVLPEGLADLPPGPQLAAVLAGIDVARVANNQLLPVLVAQSRQAAHEAARLLGVIAEVGRANPTFDDEEIDRLAHPFIHSPDEVRAALSWSRRAADRECDLAEQLVHDLPLVYTAFLHGHIDRPKVRVFADHLAGLTPDQIQQICQILIPIAGNLTPGQIAHRLRRLIAAIDPRHYERRYRKALRDRLVYAYLDDNGTAVLCARGLSPAQATAALDRIDALAHATRHAGHPSTLDQIRVDILAGLLDATLHHLTRDQIITHLITNRSTNDDPPPNPPAASPDVAASADAAGAAEAADLAEAADVAEASGKRAATGDRCGAAVGEAGAGRSAASSGDAGDAGDALGGDTVDEAATNPAESAAAGPAAPSEVQARAGGAVEGADGAAGEDQRTGIEVRVALSTLLGHDEHPGEIPALGPIPAAEAREIVGQQRRAEWRYAITDPHGRLIFDGTTRRRPDGLSPAGPPGGIVELHIPATLLHHLTTGNDPARTGACNAPPTGTGTAAASLPPLHAWQAVLADIARQYADRDRRDLDAHPHDRLPRAGLRRHTQIRDRTCIGVGCRQRPRRCDQDHTIDHQHGGKTTAADLAPVCRHDHTLKHDAGWTLQQPAPGTFTWTSPLGGRYHVQPEPIQPTLPDPYPGPDEPIDDEPAPASPERLRLWRPPPPPTPPPPTGDPDEPPPF